MATFSTVLGLKLNAPSDPFQLSDFIQNWGILDASPGIFICTSTSRPSWSAAQSGRLIFMSDLKQLSFWNGTTWNDLRDAAPVFAGGTFVNSVMNPGTTASRNILTLTTPRPCALSIILAGSYSCANNQTQEATQWASFDGVKQQMGGFGETIRFAGNSGDSGASTSAATVSIAVIPSVTAGQHTIGVMTQVSSSYKASIAMIGVKVIGLMSVYSSGNSL